MTYSIVFSSRTGNTEQLARAIRSVLPAGDCLYFGGPDAAALAADRLYIGFWTEKGSCDEAMAAFLAGVQNKEVFLFGTAGFGSQPAYFQAVLKRVQANLGANNTLVGSFMCQGRMPKAVRRRYETMLAAPDHAPNLEAMIENFDRALSHPDAADLSALTRAVLPAARD